MRFAAHFGFRPDFCAAKDRGSKGIVENLVGYARRDLMVPLGAAAEVLDLVTANTAAATWCTEVNAARHTGIAAVPAERLAGCRKPFGLPALSAA